MAKITDEIKQFVETVKISYVATADRKGMPNVSPKGPLRIVDNKTIAFADLFSKKTRENIKENPNVAVSVVDVDALRGYQFRGTAELITEGPLFDQICHEIERPYHITPKVKSIVKIHVKDIYDLAPPGEYYLE